MTIGSKVARKNNLEVWPMKSNTKEGTRRFCLELALGILANSVPHIHIEAKDVIGEAKKLEDYINETESVTITVKEEK